MRPRTPAAPGSTVCPDVAARAPAAIGSAPGPDDDGSARASDARARGPRASTAEPHAARPSPRSSPRRGRPLLRPARPLRSAPRGRGAAGRTLTARARRRPRTSPPPPRPASLARRAGAYAASETVLPAFSAQPAAARRSRVARGGRAAARRPRAPRSRTRRRRALELAEEHLGVDGVLGDDRDLLRLEVRVDGRDALALVEDARARAGAAAAGHRRVEDHGLGHRGEAAARGARRQCGISPIDAGRGESSRRAVDAAKVPITSGALARVAAPTAAPLRRRP